MNSEYLVLFREAQERTKKFALRIPRSVQVKNHGKILNDKMTLKVADTFSEVFREWSNIDFVGECLKSHVIFQPYLEKTIGLPVTYTVGYIEGESQNYFEFSEHEARNWITEGIPKEKTKLHSWLSLPSGEIIDLAFLATFAKVNEINLPKGAIIADYPSNLNGMKYVPMFLGAGFLQKIGALRIDFKIY